MLSKNNFVKELWTKTELEVKPVCSFYQFLYFRIFKFLNSLIDIFVVQLYILGTNDFRKIEQKLNYLGISLSIIDPQKCYFFKFQAAVREFQRPSPKPSDWSLEGALELDLILKLIVWKIDPIPFEVQNVIHVFEDGLRDIILVF